MFRQPDLAATLTAIAEKGAAEFYRGDIARRIVADLEKNGGMPLAQGLCRSQGGLGGGPSA